MIIEQKGVLAMRGQSYPTSANTNEQESSSKQNFGFKINKIIELNQKPKNSLFHFWKKKKTENKTNPSQVQVGKISWKALGQSVEAPCTSR